jgi:hypothetical protein
MELKELKDILSEIMLNGADEGAIISLCKEFAISNLEIVRNKIYMNDYVETYSTEVIDKQITKIKYNGNECNKCIHK